MLSRPERLWRIGGTAGIILAGIAAFCWRPELLPLPPCLFREMTGLSCLTCGLTRSLHAMAHGDLVGAAAFHLLGPLWGTAAAVAGGIWGTEAVRGRRVRLPISPTGWRVAGIVTGAVWVGYWVFRLIGELR